MTANLIRFFIKFLPVGLTLSIYLLIEPYHLPVWRLFLIIVLMITLDGAAQVKGRLSERFGKEF